MFWIRYFPVEYKCLRKWKYLLEIPIPMHLKSKSVCDIYERMFRFKIIESLQKVDYGMHDIALRMK